MEVIIGEVPGGMFSAMLTVEVEGQEYALNREQGPILPIFKRAELSRDEKDVICEYLTADHATVEGGPVFSGLAPVARTNRLAVVENAVGGMDAAAEAPWMIRGRAVAATYIKTIGDQVVLRTPEGRQLRVDEAALSEPDRERVALANPPRLNMTFLKKSDQRVIKTTPFLNETPPRILDYVFGAKVEQASARLYERPLTLELYVLGRQRLDDNKFILLDHQTGSFTFSEANGRAHKMRGRTVEVMSYDRDQPMGRVYSDYLLVATDARGEIVQHAASANWLFPNRDKLARLKVGDFLNDEAERVYPTGPGPRSLYY